MQLDIINKTVNVVSPLNQIEREDQYSKIDKDIYYLQFVKEGREGKRLGDRPLRKRKEICRKVEGEERAAQEFGVYCERKSFG